MGLRAYLNCVSCDLAVQPGIYNSDFLGIFLKIVLPPVVFMMPLLYLYFRSEQGGQNYAVTKNGEIVQRTVVAPVVVFSLLLGIGMGGFVDGILLHQILQWHQMISGWVEPNTVTAKNINMFWDGIFHAVTWTATFVGILLMWRARRRSDLNLSNHIFAGGLIAGWGIFNFIDSIFNHYLFGFHNVRENVARPEAWNLGFLFFALALMVAGAFLIQKGMRK
jgi:uncharacterized membrane protein